MILSISGCEQREQQSCRMANEYVVAKNESAPGALEVMRLDPDRIAVFWSADGTSFFSLINNDGIPQTKPLELSPKAQAPTGETKTFWSKHKQYRLNAVSISASRISDDQLAVSLLCLAGDNATAVFSVRVNVRTHSVERIARVGTSGLYARHISQMVHQGKLVVGWPDTTHTPQQVRIAVLNAQTLDEISSSVIAQKEAVFGPTLQSNGNAAVVLWSKVAGKTVPLFATPYDKLETPDSEQLVDTLELFHADAHAVPYRKGFAVVYRDNRDGDRTEEFYFTVIDATGKKRQAAERISRADGPQGPKLSVGDEFLFSAAIRSYNNNYLVGFNRFSSSGTKTGGEFQVYADKCDFTRAGIATSGDKVVLVYAENAGSSGRILASTITCGKKK
ncbi:MAG: hypothetical protein JXX29_07965 [Deltaproteobacteria bacterium]|nr:hypothetical protein [Deltaproteobacteria bacterium]MBN2671594.1 hypothetical protein [Deltaproteobacteria bacterium]